MGADSQSRRQDAPSSRLPDLFILHSPAHRCAVTLGLEILSRKKDGPRYVLS